MPFFNSQSTEKKELPVIPLHNVVIYPNLYIPLSIAAKHSLAAVDYAMQHEREAFFVAVRKPGIQKVKPNDCFPIGTIGKIRKVTRHQGRVLKVEVLGSQIAESISWRASGAMHVANVAVLPETAIEKTERTEAWMYSLQNQFKECVALGVMIPFEEAMMILSTVDPVELTYLLGLHLDLKIEEKQKILEEKTLENKLIAAGTAINRLLKILRLSKKIQTETGKELGKMEKEAVLREQMKAIEKELGAAGGKTEMEELRAKIEKAGMPEQAKEQAQKELKRLERMPSFNPEASYIRTYLDWLTELPWSKKTEGKLDIKTAEKILDEDHYGLEKVKERVLEFLAVQKLAGKIKGPILCFVGPPGTGKTSIGKSIARALNRKFVRMSLGGVRDEAEIRGHRRTYVGALPGRVIQGVKTAGVRNPVFMLDEVDKMGFDFLRGDPSAALLEALDPEQNFAFSDHYLEVPFDLSDVMFITTANYLDPVPPALRDRMEVIEFPGYIEDEKFHIAKGFLLPKQIKEHGLSLQKLQFKDGAIRLIIREYTREAGVRNLERNIAAICRKKAKEVAEKEKEPKSIISAAEVRKYLGPAKYFITKAEKKDGTGLATGLAWTEAGGDILLIEATKMPGKGNLILTGHLGKVMRESATAAFSYTRSRAGELKIAEKFYQDADIHIHVPSGAIPKDGPSAGIAIAAALISLLTKQPMRRDVGMTGEITLRGRVLEIGGIKEKVLAAHRAGLKTVVLPKNNKKDIEDIPKNVLHDLKFVFVEHMDEALKEIFRKN